MSMTRDEYEHTDFYNVLMNSIKEMTEHRGSSSLRRTYRVTITDEVDSVIMVPVSVTTEAFLEANKGYKELPYADGWVKKR